MEFRDNSLPNHTLINEWLENLCEASGVSTSEDLSRFDLESEIDLVKEAIYRDSESLEDVLVSLRVYLEVLEDLLGDLDYKDN